MIKWLRAACGACLSAPKPEAADARARSPKPSPEPAPPVVLGKFGSTLRSTAAPPTTEPVSHKVVDVGGSAAG